MAGPYPKITEVTPQWKKIAVIIGSILITLILLIAGLIGVIDASGGRGTGDPWLARFTQTFLGIFYIPIFIVLGLAIAALVVAGSVMMFRSTSGTGTSIKFLILLGFVCLLVLIGSVGPLVGYLPHPNTVYLVALGVLLAASLVFHLLGMLAVDNQVSLAVKVGDCLLVIPYVFASVFSTVTLFDAMLNYVAHAEVEIWIEKLCAGILSPLWAVACLFIPTGVLMVLGEGKPDRPWVPGKQPAPVPDERRGQGAVAAAVPVEAGRKIRRGGRPIPQASRRPPAEAPAPARPAPALVKYPITTCPGCGMRVLPKADGTCPSCQMKIA